jgi:DNA-binding MarR family transcriptional regulator
MASTGRARRTAPHRAVNNARAGADDDRRSLRALDMNAFVPAVLTNLAQKISATASALYRPRFGVGITDWRIMALLASEPWTAPVRICEATGLDKGAVSRSLRDLVQAGLVEIRDVGANRRRLPAALTPQGLAIHDELVEAALAREAQLLRAFSPDERATLLQFLGRMQAQVDRPRPAAAEQGVESSRK